MSGGSPARRARVPCGLALLLGAGLVACAAFERPVAPNAAVAIEIWSGYAQPPSLPPARPGHVEVLLDVSRSMRAATGDGPPRYAAAREAAARLVYDLPDTTWLGVSALGLARGASCTAATRLARGAPPGFRPELTSNLRHLAPASEGSLGLALLGIAGELGDAAEGARVVVFTDLGGECGGDLCAAAGELVAAGAQLDLVVLGDAPAPACLARLGPRAAPSLALMREAERQPPAFRVEPQGGDVPPTERVIARGRADGRPVRVPPGPVLLVLEMEPPSVIGPIELAEGTTTRVRVLDFPALASHVREWRWDVEPLAPAQPTTPDAGPSTDAATAATPPRARAVAQPG